MPHLQYDPVTKHLVHNRPAGAKHLVHTCEALAAAYRLDPCVDVVSTCAFCPANETPEFLTMTLTDAVTCINCIDNGANGFDNFNISLNGSYVLPRVGNCSWENTSFGSWSYDKWTGRDCTGDMTSLSGTWRVKLFRREFMQWVLNDMSSVPAFTRLNMVFPSQIGDASCDNIPEFTSQRNCEKRPFTTDLTPIEFGMKVNFEAGDRITPNVRCPGGESYYTNTDLSAVLGKRVEIAEDPDICYVVNANSDQELADGAATVTNCWTTCPKCCDEDPEDC